ncbi:MAG: RNA polymerase sigma factor [Gemmatimonadota bacterium]
MGRVATRVTGPRTDRTTADPTSGPGAAGPPSGVPDRELLDRARQGDERAFRLLVESYEGRVASVVTAMLGAGDEAEDVGQETFIQFYRSLDRFRGEAALGTYLTRIAINLSRNALRRGRREAARFESRDDPAFRGTEIAIGAGEAAVGTDEEVERRERARRVRRAIDRLDGRHRAVVALRMIEGYSTRETAAILEIPEGTVLSRLSRAMKKLEIELGLEERDG